MGFGSIVIGGNIDELQNQRSSGDNTAASRQEVSSNDVFENRGFTRGLGTNDNLEVIVITSY